MSGCLSLNFQYRGMPKDRGRFFVGRADISGIYRPGPLSDYDRASRAYEFILDFQPGSLTPGRAAVNWFTQESLFKKASDALLLQGALDAKLVPDRAQPSKICFAGRLTRGSNPL